MPSRHSRAHGPPGGVIESRVARFEQKPVLRGGRERRDDVGALAGFDRRAGADWPPARPRRVHQIAYARAVELLTGADLSKMFPAPRIPTEKIPECKPHIKRGDHRRLYRFSPSDYLEFAAVFKGPHPETGGERSSRSSTSRRRARPRTTCPHSPPCSRRIAPPRGDRRDRRQAPQAGRAG